MTKEFEQYIHDTRNEFVSAVNELQWNTGFRTKCENLLIAYDQMKQALQQPPVVVRSEQFVCGANRVMGEKRCEKQCGQCEELYPQTNCH